MMRVWNIQSCTNRIARPWMYWSADHIVYIGDNQYRCGERFRGSYEEFCNLCDDMRIVRMAEDAAAAA